MIITLAEQWLAILTGKKLKLRSVLIDIQERNIINQ